MTHPVLTATYRLQLHKNWALDDARRIVPYLDRLGVSHIYTSPVLTARPGSTHGYDVIDPTALNPELGAESDRRALVGALHARRMGWLLDIVPNHMGTGSSNPFWEAVLTHGRHSRYAHWFDIDWDAPQRWLHGRVMLPVLGDELDAVLERGEIRVVAREGGGRLRFAYHENTFPIDPDTVSDDLRGIALDRRETSPGQSSNPARNGGGNPPDCADERLARHFAGDDGRRRLRTLLDRQHYALAFWRRAARDINYRRFFEINDLVSLRAEDPNVFDETHALVLRWVRDGDLDGLRVDHIDGLLDPLAYLERLRRAVGNGAGEGNDGPPGKDPMAPAAASSNIIDMGGGPRAPRQPPVIVVEKILSPGEKLRGDWPVEGTTGYEVMNDLEATFIDPGGFERLDAHYRRLLRIRHARLGFAEVARRGKLYILRRALQADVLRLARLLAPIARRDPAAATLPREALAEAIVQLIADLPVYRTYIGERSRALHPADRAVLETALAGARGRGGTSTTALDFLGRVLLEPLRIGGGADGSDREHSLFIERFQQTSGPATAKGVEDTALYIYIPLASRNEVGGDPERDIRGAVATLHSGNAERAERWPQSLVATNTHDTKRSADMRARLDVLSEIPEEWAAHVLRWRRWNRRHRRKVRGRLEPDSNTEYILYQSLVGIWPVNSLPEARFPPAALCESLRGRLEQYILKAAREGKMRTTWTDQNAGFEDAMVAFLHGMIEGGERSPFLSDLDRFVRRIARPGLWNALSRVLLHLASPGTPDLYQGDELWNFALVDPDNRRPVDYTLRERILQKLEREFNDEVGGDSMPAAEGRDAIMMFGGAPRARAPRPDFVRDLITRAEDGRVKLHAVRQMLHARREDPALWRAGSYLPLAAEGARARHVVAFARQLEGRAAIALASRLPMTLVSEDGGPPVGEDCWTDTVLRLPPLLGGRRWTCALGGHSIYSAPPDDGDVLHLGNVFRLLPIALLRPAGIGDAT
ncbi:MAG: malto-oligosyltrehalose synthase [Gemmatimonadota bacterium]|nr:malto-oligosyltrehalose synthase [Gemmatimonadota bacterium]